MSILEMSLFVVLAYTSSKQAFRAKLRSASICCLYSFSEIHKMLNKRQIDNDKNGNVSNKTAHNKLYYLSQELSL